MKIYLGVNKLPILNGEYKVLKSVDYLTDLVAVKNFKNGLLDGLQYSLDNSGLVNEILNYNNGNLIEKIEVNDKEKFLDLFSNENRSSKRNGKYILHAKNETSIFNLKNGLFEGTKWIYDDNDRYENPILLSVENFQDSHHLGEQVFFHEDGNIMLIEYYQNIYDSISEKSTWFDYDENGNLVSERNFRRNKKDGKHLFYENGKLYKELSYREGKLFGPSIYHKEDGSKIIIDYEFGFKVGERKEGIISN